jgi:hypothetical protein
MYRVQTKADRINLLEKLRDFIIKFENGSDTGKELEAWRKWNLLGHEKQLKILAEWEKYYKEVQETPIYALFQEQRLAASKNDWGRVKELADQAREMRKNGDDITLTKPTSIDPWEFNHSGTIKCYLEAQEKIKELTNYPDLKKDDELEKVFE